METGDDLPPPSADGCPYEQLAVYTYGDNIVVQPDLLAKLTLTGRTAFYLHEALYALARKYSAAVDSLLVQELVAHLFERSLDPASIRRLAGALFPNLPTYDHCLRRPLPAFLNNTDPVVVHVTPVVSPTSDVPFEMPLYLNPTDSGTGFGSILITSIPTHLSSLFEVSMPISP